MSKVFAIAFNTFKEAVRNRVLYVLLFFAILIMLGAWIAGTLSIDDQTKIVRDLGAGAINFIAVLIAVFVGVGLVYNDLDKKTIYTIVSKPISRWQFLLGKYLGLLLTIAVNVLFMTYIFCAVLVFREYVASERLMEELYSIGDEGQLQFKGAAYQLGYYATSAVKALVVGLAFGFDGMQATQGLFLTSILTIMEMAVITSFAILFSSFSSPTLSAFLTVGAFIVGRLNHDLYLFAQTMLDRAGGLEGLSAGQQVAYYFATGAAHVCPNLTLFFDRRQELSNFEAIHVAPVDVLYMVVYTSLVMAIAVMVFNRKNFK